MTTLRPAQQSDLYEIVKMGEEFLNESRFYGNVPPDVNTFLLNMVRAMVAPDWWVRVSLVDGQHAGFYVGKRTKQIFSNHCIAHDIVLFTRKQFRTHVSLRRTLNEFDEWAFQDPMCIAVSLMSPASKQDDKIAKVMPLLGYLPHGGVFIKRRK